MSNGLPKKDTNKLRGSSNRCHSKGLMETLRMESRGKWFLPQLESLRMERLRIERLRMERLRIFFSPNLNHSGWKDSEGKDVEILLAQTGITQNGKTQNTPRRSFYLKKDVKPDGLHVVA
jgi:hypothetical protein